MKKYILILGLLIHSASLHSQWVSNYWGNNQGDDPILNSKGMSVAADYYGNSYVTGYTYNSQTNNDIILIKYNQNGDTVFVKTYNGNANGDDRAFGIVVDEDRNIYLVGQVSITGKGLELIVLKYNRFGNLMWTRTYGATNSNKDDIGQKIAIDREDNIYVTGFVTDQNNQKNIVIIKYRPNGARAWLKTEDGEGGADSEGFGIAVDSDNFIYITGFTTPVNNINNADIITQKYAENGTLKWTKFYNGEQNKEDKAFGISVDDLDNLYVSGYTTISINPLNTSAVLIKYKSNGVQKWVKKHESGVSGSLDKAWGIIVDEDKIYITGQVSSSNHLLNYFTNRYNVEGAKLWTNEYDGPGHGDDYANSIAVLHNGKVAVTGASWGITNNFDYATLVLNKNNGHLQNEYRYSMDSTSNDIAKEVTSSENDIYVTGYSEMLQYAHQSGSSAVSTLSYIGKDDDENNPGLNTPGKFSLYQNYPNPFNPSTTIKFDIPEKSNVKLQVYDILGKVVDIMIDQVLEAGSYSYTYANKNLSSGVYFYQLTAGDFSEVKKMSLIK